MKETNNLESPEVLDGDILTEERKKQDAFRVKYIKAAEDHRSMIECTRDMVEVKDEIDSLPLKERIILMIGSSLFAYAKFMTNLHMKYLDSKVDAEAKKLNEEFERLSKEAEEQGGEAISRLGTFVAEKMVYHFSEAQLQERDAFLVEQSAKLRKELIEMYPALSSLTDEETEYLGLLNKAQNPAEPGKSMKKWGTLCSSFGGQVADSELSPDEQLAEFLRTHKFIDRKLFNKLI